MRDKKQKLVSNTKNSKTLTDKKDDIELTPCEEVVNETTNAPVDNTPTPTPVKDDAITTIKPGSEIVPSLANVPERTARIKSFEDLPYPVKIDILASCAKDPKTGLNSPQNAIMLFEKARELKIGWANAVSHMHFIKDKLGIDLHIIKAILSKPGTGIKWEKVEDYEPKYQYYDGVNLYDNDDMLPKRAVIVTAFPKGKDPSDTNLYVVPVPTNIAPAGKPAVYKLIPNDFRTTYIFTRKKKDIDGSWMTVTEKGTFSWNEAKEAKLPYNSSGELDSNSNWAKYRKLMIATRAFTFGAREIASDLLLGAYETTELFDMSGVKYDAKDHVKED